VIVNEADSPWFAAALPAALVTPFPGVERHLGLGCDWWPRFDGDGPWTDAVAAATDWYAFDTLVGEEWQPVMRDQGTAKRYFLAARQFHDRLALLCFNTAAQPAALGWDVGLSSGGHSVLMHEPGLSAFVDSITLTRDGLFASRQDAVDFLALRAARGGSLALEDLGAWGVVCVSRIDRADRGGCA
jgi:hypothetical protein